MKFNSFYLTESTNDEISNRLFSISTNKKSIIIKKIINPIVKSNGIISLLELFHLAKKKNKVVDLEIGTNFDKFCEDLNLLEYKDGIKIIAALLLEHK